MSSFLYRLGRTAARARGLVLVVWVVALVAVGGGALLVNQGTDDTFAIPGSESQDTLDYLKHVFPQVSGASAQVVVLVPAGQRVDTPAAKDSVAVAVARLKKVEQVSTVIDPFAKNVKNAVSPDHRAALVAVLLKVNLADVSAATKHDVSGIAASLQKSLVAGSGVYPGGDAFSNHVPKLSATEAIGILIALLVLLLVFKSFIAAGMPLLTAIFGVGISVGLIFAATVFTPISSTAPMLAVMLGLAVGIDYALFILSRHRDQLAEGLDVEESIARATATAGSAVIFAGLTVVIAVLGLAVAGIPFLTTMGIAAAVAVCFAVLIAVTLIPALLGFAGERLRPRAPRTARVKKKRRRVRPSLSHRWVSLVTRVPAVTVVIVVVLLGLCTLPALGLRLALPDNGAEDVGSPSRTTYDLVAEHFGPGFNGPLLVTVDIIASTDPIGVTEKIAAEIERVPGVAAVPLATPNPKADTAIIQVVPTTAPDSPQTEELVSRLRALEPHFLAKYGTATAVTGLTAVGIDVSAKLGGALLPFGLLVVGLSLILLAMVFRSVAVPIKATLGYLLSVGAAFGATSFVFVQGHLAGVLNVTHVGNVISFLPIILMGVLFGLAMDYEVFLVSRIREDYVHNRDPHHAIESGFVSASRVVVSAAIIMFAVFAAFVPEGSATIKPIAFSLAVGVFIDAFVVRMTLVPAVLALLGHRAWWLPTWLDRKLPIFDAEGDSMVRELRLADWPAPSSAEVISARQLRVGDDRDRTVFAGVELHVWPGQIVGLYGPGPSGKSALLFTLAGRVSRVDGDLKVLGQVLPQHAHTVRTKAALISCRDTDTAADQARDAVAAGIELVLLDDLDTVVNTAQRDILRDLFANPGRATFVFTCQNPVLLQDILPPDTLVTVAMTAQPVGVA